MNKKIVMMTTVALAAAVALAAPKRKPVVAADDDAPTTGKEAKIMLDQFPKLGRQSTLPAPSLQGGSIVGKCYTKPRSWIVLEASYLYPSPRWWDSSGRRRTHSHRPARPRQ